MAPPRRRKQTTDITAALDLAKAAHGRVLDTDEEMERVRAARRLAVGTARRAGASLQDVADALGVSRETVRGL